MTERLGRGKEGIWIGQDTDRAQGITLIYRLQR